MAFWPQHPGPPHGGLQQHCDVLCGKPLVGKEARRLSRNGSARETRRRLHTLRLPTIWRAVRELCLAVSRCRMRHPTLYSDGNPPWSGFVPFALRTSARVRYRLEIAERGVRQNGAAARCGAEYTFSSDWSRRGRDRYRSWASPCAVSVLAKPSKIRPRRTCGLSN